ncbi:16S rRNA (guanine966-N2)-methyltransferase [Motilibacter rhizosphaerae]|uniref:16S rRNA (Guanine966-N2)-methyltransferase n=1 Tax=Motilibacter rhizosphaerae TaxID=598652 RepID=A0A4Q7NPM8_9ACTN|nr:16S rRNA (guanine(966)-N(2))-methyltransferase RsmD [Motilibacter rhizosphaerae]RZS87008.1 16S rRNA (guanine966-N2)-methyltransferase [Motilibacter rhizosphaerae]
MTRVIAGAAGGRRLAVPPSGTRPTSDRAREGLFSTLQALAGPLDGLRVADLYAGSGAVGLEALSRGAVGVVLVESAPRAVAVVRANAASLGLPGAEVLALPVERAAAAPPPGGPVDVAFLDPPYALEASALAAVLADLAASGWFAPEAVVAVERATRGGAFPWPAGFAALRERAYGEATIWYAAAP